MKKILILLTALLIIGAWGNFIYGTIKTPKLYQEKVIKGDAASDRKLYFEARNEYFAAKELQSSYGLDLKILDTYDKLEEEEEYISYALQMREVYPEQIQVYEKIALKYYEREDYNQLVSFLMLYPDIMSQSEKLQDIYENVEKKYDYIPQGYAEIKLFRSEVAAVLQTGIDVSQEGKDYRDLWLLVNKAGQPILEEAYEDVQVSEDCQVCFIQDINHEWYAINTGGYIIARNAEREFERIYPMSTLGLAVAVIDGTYHYINTEMKVADIPFDYASNFSEGIGAVRKGDRWALVDGESWTGVADYPFESIAVNLENCCIKDGIVVVKRNGKYSLTDSEGNLLSQSEYEELKAFESEQPTAYRKGDKWGFVNRYGDVYIEAQYEDALPFTNGYAAVKKDGLWGYINKDNMIVVEPQFIEALPIFSSGLGYVKSEDDTWGFVSLYILQFNPQSEG